MENGSTNPVSLFLAMMALDIGFDLTSLLGNVTLNVTSEDNIPDNSGCESQICESK